MMKKQSSMRSLGKLLATTFTGSKDEVNKHLLAPPSVVEPFVCDDDDDDLGDPNDPLIGRTIDADQTIEDEVRNLLGLAPGAGTSVKPPTNSDRNSTRKSRSASNLDYDNESGCADTNNKLLSRRSELRKSKSGDGTGSRYVRRKHDGAAPRQRSMRRMSTVADSITEEPAAKQEETPNDDRRRTLTKIRKSTRRLVVTSNESDERLGDNESSEERRKPVPRNDSSSSKRKEGSKSRRKLPEKGGSSARRQSFRDKQSTSREPETAADGPPRQLSSRDKRPSSRRLSVEGSSRRLSLRDKRPSSRRVSLGEKVSSSRPFPEQGESRRSSSKDIKSSFRKDNESDIDMLEQAVCEFSRKLGTSTRDMNKQQSFRVKPESDDEVKEINNMLKPSPRDTLPPSERQTVKKSSSQGSSRRRRESEDERMMKKRSTRPREKTRRSLAQPTVTDPIDQEGLSSSDDNDSVADILDTSENENDEKPDQQNEETQFSKTAPTAPATITNILPPKTADMGDIAATLQVSDAPRNSKYLELKKRPSLRKVTREPYREKARVIADLVGDGHSHNQLNMYHVTPSQLVEAFESKEVPFEFSQNDGDGVAKNEPISDLRSMDKTDQLEDQLDSKSLSGGDEIDEVPKDHEGLTRQSDGTEADDNTEIDRADDQTTQAHGNDLSEADTLQSSIGSGLHFVDNDVGSWSKAEPKNFFCGGSENEWKPDDSAKDDISLKHQQMDASTSSKANDKADDIGSELSGSVGIDDDSCCHAESNIEENGNNGNDNGCPENDIQAADDCVEATLELQSFGVTSNIGENSGGDHVTRQMLEELGADASEVGGTLMSAAKEVQAPVSKVDLFITEKLEHFRLGSDDKGRNGDKRRRRLSDSVFWRSESALKVDDDDVRPSKAIEIESDFGQGESQYARRRSEGAIFIQSSINDLLLSPISNASSHEDRKPVIRETVNENLKEDRWAAISPMRPITFADNIAIKNELLFSPDTDIEENGKLSSTRSFIDRNSAPNLPARTLGIPQSSSRAGRVFSNGSGSEPLLKEEQAPIPPAASTSDAKRRRKSTSAMREPGTQTRSLMNGAENATEEDVKGDLESLKQRLRDDRWAPISPMQPIVPSQSSSQRRKSLDGLRTLSKLDGDESLSQDQAVIDPPENRFEMMKQELREDRWAPISPMRPIVPTIGSQKLRASGLVAPAMTPENNTQRWASSASNELTVAEADIIRATKAMGRKRIDDCRSDSEISFDESSLGDYELTEEADDGVDTEDVDDAAARAVAQHVAHEHSTHEKSIAAASRHSRKDDCCSKGSSHSRWQVRDSPSVIQNREDECARMIARKTALEHLIDEHVNSLSKLRMELKQVESRIDVLTMLED